MKNEVTTANKATVNDPAKSSGTRNRRSLATDVSTKAMAPAKSRSFTASATKAVTSAAGVFVSATPHGKKRLDNNVKNKNNFIPAAHSTSARRRPEYSRTMAS